MGVLAPIARSIRSDPQTTRAHKERVRCGTEVVLQAASENIDGSIKWEIKQGYRIIPHRGKRSGLA
jgi:hypothetical protein